MAYPLSPAIPSCRLPEVSHEGNTTALPLSTGTRGAGDGSATGPCSAGGHSGSFGGVAILVVGTTFSLVAFAGVFGLITCKSV